MRNNNRAKQMILASGLTKIYNSKTVVDNVELNIKQGNIFGLLGPNGAGKTTVIRMLCGVIKADQGDIKIDGLSVEAAKNKFGYVAQHFGQYEELSVWENVKFYASLYGIHDQTHLLTLVERYGLTAYKNQSAGSLSGGYQRRLALVCALVHEPKVLFLDEPTAGIDPVTRKLLWDDFYQLSTEGKTLFVTTHYMEEAQRCHQLAFLSAGKIVATGSPTSIKEALGEVNVYSVKLLYQPRVHSALNKLNDILLVNQFGDELRIVTEPTLSKAMLANTISEITKEPCELTLTEANLEDVFIALTQSKEVVNI